MSRTVRLFLFAFLLPLAGAAQWDTIAKPFRLLTIKDGLSQGMVNHITQDRFGFMWFATKEGLNRYDGYEFKVYRHDATDEASVAENYVTALHEGPEGGLWVGTASKGLDVLDREHEMFEHVDLGPEGNAAYVLSITHDLHRNIWVATNAGLFKVRMTSVGKVDRTRPATRYFNKQCRVTCDKDGRIWGYLMSSWAFRIRPSAFGSDRVDTLAMQGLGEGLWNEDRATSVNGNFVVDPVAGRVFGVFPYFIAEYDAATLVPTIVHRVPYPGGSRMQVEEVFISDRGMMWIASNEIWRFAIGTKKLSRVLSADPNMNTTMTTASCAFEDRNGLIWIGTLGYGVLSYDPRIERFNAHLDGSVYWMQSTPNSRMVCQRPGKFLRVFDPVSGTYVIDRSDASMRSKLNGPMHETQAAVQDEAGVFWMCKGGLVSYDPRTDHYREFPITDTNGVALEQTANSFPLFMEGNEALWFSCDSALFRFDKRNHRFDRFPYPIPPDQMPYLFVQSIHQDKSGIFWIGTVKGLLRLDPVTRQWTHFHNDPDDPSSLSYDLIFTLRPDPKQPERYLWIGTNGGGLNRFDMTTGRCDRFTQKDGLPNDVVYGILDDNEGDLWMSTNKGISRFSPASGTFRNYDATDGLQGDEFNRNAFCKLDDGRLFFGGINGFNYFRPEDLHDETIEVDVVITDIKLINRSVDIRGKDSPLQAPTFLSSSMEIPYSVNMVTFEFASMEFSAPRSHTYQYMLEGFDEEWIMSGTNNSAIYTNLDPGEYTFRVRSADREGQWSDEATSFDLMVQYPWYNTWSSYGVIALLMVGGGFLFIRNLKWKRIRLERTVRVRTLELSREKDRSDELLRNILPTEVAAELKTLGRTKAKHYEKVTVLFSDFEDFTKVGEKLSPAELVEELNICFKAFDRIMEKYGIEKIKTIGDSYMAAGGVPDVRSGKPLDVVRAALEMQAVMVERRTEREAMGKPFFLMRVGINTGPVVAGVVGLKKFQYDIWGDTVNIASRMESSSDIGRVNISADTYAEVRNTADLEFTPRGRVQAKGKGEMEMYFVDLKKGAPKLDTSMLADVSWGAIKINDPKFNGKVMELKGLRILLAEDNEFNVIVAQGELEDAFPGVTVEVAQNGAVAVRMVRNKNYDLVLMDIQMPEMNGYEATRAIRALPGDKSRIPIVALTANTMQAERDRCQEAGMDGFIPKPFRRKELLGALREVLAGKSA